MYLDPTPTWPKTRRAACTNFLCVNLLLKTRKRKAPLRKSSDQTADSTWTMKTILLNLTVIALLITVVASDTPATAYTNHTVGGPAGWSFDAINNISATNYSSWAANQTYNLGDYLSKFLFLSKFISNGFLLPFSSFSFFFTIFSRSKQFSTRTLTRRWSKPTMRLHLAAVQPMTHRTMIPSTTTVAAMSLVKMWLLLSRWLRRVLTTFSRMLKMACSASVAWLLRSPSIAASACLLASTSRLRLLTSSRPVPKLLRWRRLISTVEHRR